ncbi:MAG: HAD-IA family hydrolase [Gemmataceae bacterium]
MIPYAAVLFDLDGTLIDSFAAISASVNHVRRRRGLPALSEAEVSVHVGRGAEWLMREVVPVGEVQENLRWYHEHHPQVIRPMTRLLPGAATTLQQLHAAGKRLGICSNKPVNFTRQLVTYLEIDPYLDTLLGPEEVARPKPAPDMLLEAMRRLGSEPAQTLYVGDMTVDIETARAAGVTIWAIATGTQSAEQLLGADRVLQRLEELLGR